MHFCRVLCLNVHHYIIYSFKFGEKTGAHPSEPTLSVVDPFLTFGVVFRVVFYQVLFRICEFQLADHHASRVTSVCNKSRDVKSFHLRIIFHILFFVTYGITKIHRVDLSYVYIILVFFCPLADVSSMEIQTSGRFIVSFRYFLRYCVGRCPSQNALQLAKFNC